MNGEMREAAAEAIAWQIIEQAAKTRKDAAKARLSELEPGDTVAGRWDGQTLGRATKTAGRTKLVVTDERKLIEWLQYHHPDEITLSPNSAWLKQVEDRARSLGEPVDSAGEMVPGVQLVTGEPYVSVRKDKDAPFLVAQLLAGGRIRLDGIKALEDK